MLRVKSYSSYVHRCPSCFVLEPLEPCHQSVLESYFADGLRHGCETLIAMSYGRDCHSAI